MHSSDLVERTPEIRILLEQFQLRNWCAVLAPPLSGKTTLARQARDALSLKHPSWQVCLIELDPAGTLGELWSQIQTDCSLCDLNAACPVRPNGPVPIADLLYESLQGASRPLCLLIDNLDALPDQVLRMFAEELRRFLNDDDFCHERDRLHLILLGELKLHYLTGSDTSPLATIIKLITLNDLSFEQSTELLGRGLHSPSISPESSQLLFEATDGHPHLVAWLSNRLSQKASPLKHEDITIAITDWVQSSLDGTNDDSDCFERIVSFLEHNPSTFSTILLMLDGHDVHCHEIEDMDHVMGGAVRSVNGFLRFRGSMIRNALHLYFDDLRRADYWVLHGDWKKAHKIYADIAVDRIRVRRSDGTAISKRRIMDLFLSVSPHAMRLRTVSRAVEFVCAAGRNFFGADQVYLWQIDSSDEAVRVVGEYPAPSASRAVSEFEVEMVDAAIRKEATFTLDSNQGVIRGIGDEVSRLRWALELRYDRGLPNDPGFSEGLNNVEPTLFMVLDRARQREMDDRRLHDQRGLIHEIALRLMGASDLDEVFQLIVDGVRERLGYECAQLCLVFPEDRRLIGVRTNGVFREIQDLTDRGLDEDDVLSLVVRDQEPRIVGDCHAPGSHCDKETADMAGVRSIVAVPMIDGDNVVGVLQVGDTHSFNAFSSADSEILQLLADDAAVAIRMARERSRLSQAINAAGTAMAVINADGALEYCNPQYSEFFKSDVGSRTSLVVGGDANVPLVRLAYDRGHEVTTVRQQEGREYLVSAIGLADSFGRFGGGIEVAGTRNPILGLTESLREMFRLTNRHDLEDAIVTCLGQRLGYSRSRLYRFGEQGHFVSACSSGMTPQQTEWFASAGARLTRSSTEQDGDGFECVRHDGPVILIQEALSNLENTPSTLTFGRDSSSRPVVVLDKPHVFYGKELDKEFLDEWVDVPLLAGRQLLGKLSVDLKGTVRRLGLEDIELLALFGRWASDALGRIVESERVEEQARYVRDSRIAGERRGLDALAWDFLLNITSGGGPGFNRAALFLRSPHTGLIQGFACHGARDKSEWRDILQRISNPPDRRQFLIDARRAKMDDDPDPEDQKRLEALRGIVVLESSHNSKLAAALTTKETQWIEAPAPELIGLCKELDWEPPENALVCPLVHDSECEGLVYVDRAFSKGKTTFADADTLESFCYNLAMIARPLRLAEQLRSQILSVSHTTISPVASIRALAEALRPQLGDSEQQHVLDLMTAEAQRSADLFRRLVRATSEGTVSITPDFRRADVASLLRGRLRPYMLLLTADGVPAVIRAPSSVYAEIDSNLLGDAFAELAANANSAIRRARNNQHDNEAQEESRPESQSFTVTVQDDSDELVIHFQNTGRLIPMAVRSRVWERFVSASGSTGIGLWLVKEIIQRHSGTIEYSASGDCLSTFSIRLPFRQKG